MGHIGKLKNPYTLHSLYDNTFFRSFGTGKHSARIENRLAQLENKSAQLESLLCSKTKEIPFISTEQDKNDKDTRGSKLTLNHNHNHNHNQNSNSNLNLAGAGAVNVYMTNRNQTHQGRHDVLNWLNERVGSNFTNVEELMSGAAYCQLMHMLFPSSIPIKKVKFQCAFDSDCVHNFDILQDAFHSVQVDKQIPADKLVEGRFLANFEFLQWFKMFFMANHNGSSYDAIEARGGIPFAVPSKNPEVWQNFSIIPNSNKTFTVSRQLQPMVDGTHRQSCQRGWFYSSSPRN